MGMDSSQQIPFRRITDPLVLSVSTTATRFDVPPDFFATQTGINAFYVINPNNFWVRLKGGTAAYSAIVDGQGWLFSPGFQGVFTTQFPVWMSTLAVTRQGLTAGSGSLELAYGMGS